MTRPVPSKCVTDSCDVIVCGLGVMGCATAAALARRGLRVVGLEQFDIPHDRGSSHGRSRVIRTAYFEDPRYVPLCRAAFGRWADLERESGRQLVFRTGVLNVGPPDHDCIRGVTESVRQHALSHERLTADEIHRRWPALVPADGDVGVFEADAGYLTPEACVLALAESARRAGADLRTQTPARSWRSDGNGVTVEMDHGQLSAGTLVITAGPWLPQVCADLGVPLRVERQVQLWFTPADAAKIGPGRTPVFIHFLADRSYYSIPPFGEFGIKVARHHGGATTTPDTVDRACRDADERDVREYLHRHLLAADGPLQHAEICLYTNTSDDHFIVDRHPRHERVWIAGGFSGHGFKFAPVIGDALAGLIYDGRTDLPIAHFKLDRFL